ncbi:MAG: allophanate hydrolase [Alteromonas sp.]|nr:allophanate hydrolase [Alteromonas sp.]MAY22089.1 allophanate hydrolase [Flavobacteriaceae bacterium]
MGKYSLTYKKFGPNGILIEWPKRIEEAILYEILAFQEIITSEYGDRVMANHAYQSILVGFPTSDFNFEKEVTILKQGYENLQKPSDKPYTIWKVPVCYEATFGWDLEALSQQKKCSEADIVQLHTQTIYTVYFIGFLPGFLYLGGLAPELFTPRRASPRLKIPAGSVAIGGEQTGIYPSESPGGWNLIGNTPIVLFDPMKEHPCFAKPGDKIQFYSIDKSQYEEMKQTNWIPESEVWHG